MKAASLFLLLVLAWSEGSAEEGPESPGSATESAEAEDSSLIIKSHDVQEDWDGKRRREAAEAAKAALEAEQKAALSPEAVPWHISEPETVAVPGLTLLPWTGPDGSRRDSVKWDRAAAAVRLGLAQSGRFRVWTEEEALRHFDGGAPLPRGCFSERCLASAAGKSDGAFLVACQFAPRDSILVLKLVLAETPTGRIRRAVQVWGNPGEDGLVAFAQEAAARLAAASGVAEAGTHARHGREIPEGPEGPINRYREGAQERTERDAGIDGIFYASLPWRTIPWLNPRDTIDNRGQWRWAGSGLLLAGIGLAWMQGQLLQEDGNDGALSRATLPDEGAFSFLRGFFAAPTLGARYAAMGGAGIAQVDNGLSLLMNPAGVAGTDRANLVAAKRTLPGGAPSFFLAYAGPLYRGWGQGLGVQYEGDRLANETTLHGTLACDLGLLGKAWEGVRTGSQLKLYLAQVGEGGSGLDRSTGHSFGMGLDLGVQARLNGKITAAVTVRDAAGFLRHANTLTNRSYGELLPPEYRVGAAYRAARNLLLLMDGQKGMYADQSDHLRLGGERTFGILALRCGLHEIFGNEAVRKLSVGFGLDTDGLGDKSLRKSRVSLNYGYEFGMAEDGPLAGGQQFSLEAGF